MAVFRLNTLVFRTGQLGDTIVALPAMWAVRRHFPGDRIAFLGDRHPRRNLVLAEDLLAGTGLFDEFLSYPVERSREGVMKRPFRMAGVLMELRRKRFDRLVYLAPSLRTARQLERDRWFFSAAGIRQLTGFKQFPLFPAKRPGEALPAIAAEADLLLARLAADGVDTPPPGEGCFDLNLGSSEDEVVAAWLGGRLTDGNRPWIGIGPGSKMPAKQWPVERYAEVVSALIASHGVWPVVFGGPEDLEVGAKLIERWGCGYNAAGQLAVRPAAAALKKCRFYLGNDTGTMHLAAAGGVACAAIFSSRDHPGRWYPSGQGHTVFRSPIECEGCRLMECVDRANECLDRISAREVLAGCRRMLETVSTDREPNNGAPLP